MIDCGLLLVNGEQDVNFNRDVWRQAESVNAVDGLQKLSAVVGSI
jgi:hypothetical protein